MGAIKVLSRCYQGATKVLSAAKYPSIVRCWGWWLVLGLVVPRHGVGVSQIGNNLRRRCQVTLAALCSPSHTDTERYIEC